MILCYELFLARKDPVPESLPRLANAFELEGMYDHLGGVLMKIGFINPKTLSTGCGTYGAFSLEFLCGPER